MDFSCQLAMSVNLQINQGGIVWHVKFQMIEPQKSYEAALISKQEEKQENSS